METIRDHSTLVTEFSGPKRGVAFCNSNNPVVEKHFLGMQKQKHALSRGTIRLRFQPQKLASLGVYNLGVDLKLGIFMLWFGPETEATGTSQIL